MPSGKKDILPEAGATSSEIILYRTEDGRSRIEVRLEGDSVWLSNAMMGELFQTTKQNISLHLKNIFAERELEERAVVKEYLTTATDGKNYRVKHYNLDVILAVGYRVRSHRGTQFRQWATERLREYLVKGFTMDDERLKEGRSLGVDYFDELLERIRDIRASEKRFYQKVRDIYKLAIDYDPTDKATREFFQIVQNKLHWAISGKTAAEIIHERADATQPNMGLTTWKGAKVRKPDVTVAKNYLQPEEIDELNRIVVMFLDFAEDHARRRRPLYMRDWREKLDAFLRFNERGVLPDAGRVRMEVAKVLALEQYERFNQRRLAEEATREEDEEEFERAARRLESKRLESNK
ncbi:MAG: virulence RhuM family protein [Pseudomonadota bacterium]